jgi:hypothetical protein
LGTDTLPGQDAIYGLLAYRAGAHWLLVTLGLTELFDKESDDATVSGWGFELTMRLPRAKAEPPAWALRLLDRLGRYVFSSGSALAPGHRMDPGGPITGTPDTRLTALAFAEDSELPSIDSPHGAARFLTVVGITRDELELMKTTSTQEVLADLAKRFPTLITDPAR